MADAPAGVDEPQALTAQIALVGNPNVGKTSLFNRLTKLLAKTSNYPGTTVEVRKGTINVGDEIVQLIDLPGVYSLEPTSDEEKVTLDFLTDRDSSGGELGIIVVVDASQLERTLFLVNQARPLKLPMIVAVNMMDIVKRHNTQVDCDSLAEQLGCPVIPVSARKGDGLSELKEAMELLTVTESAPTAELEVIGSEPCSSCSTCVYADGYRWAAALAKTSGSAGRQASHEFTDAADRVLTHEWFGAGTFLAVMLAVFALVFWVAQVPMEMLDAFFGRIADLVSNWLPVSGWSDLLTEGIIGGVGSVLVFLPQICILFFALAILEDCGYLSRAVLVVDRWMRFVGLPGQAFVPLLAAHACAIPAIMSTRVISNRRDRLAAILVIPLMTCSARLPVYSMVAAMLFPRNALYAALLFAAAYFLGMFAAFATALLLRMTILPGAPSSLILDLPPYRVPSLTNALKLAIDRGAGFIRDAGTVILFISITIWALSHFPAMSDTQFEQRLAQLSSVSGEPASISNEQTELLRSSLAQEHSILGRAGKLVEPIFAPLGFDWKTSVSVLASFAAREVVVSTLSVLYEADEDSNSLIDRVRTAKRADGSRAFDASTSISLLVFFVLAMQCMPTQAVTKKETGSWKWAVLQLVYMTALAYGAAFLARHVTLAFFSELAR